MTTAVDNVAVGRFDKSVSGGILHAPLGSPRPTGTGEAFDPTYESMGYVGSDGVTETIERATEVIRDVNGDQVRVVQTEYGGSLTFPLMESRRAATLKAIFGPDNVTTEPTTGVIRVRRNAKPLPRGQWIFAMKDEDKARILDVGDGQITEVGDITYVAGEAITYEVTLSLYPDENEDVLVEYIETGDVTGEA